MKKLTVRMPDKLNQQVAYWAALNQISANELILEAVELWIRHQNGDYDLPTMEQARLAQLMDLIAVLSQNVDSLEKVTVNGFDSLLNLTRGDNYLANRE